MKKYLSYPISLSLILVAGLMTTACSKSINKEDSTPVEAAEIDNGTASASQITSAPPRHQLVVTQNQINNLNYFLKLRDPNAPTVTLTGLTAINARVFFELDLAGVVATTWPSVQNAEGSRLRLRIEVAQRPPLRNYVLDLSNPLIQSAEIVEQPVQNNYKIWAFRVKFGGSKYDVQVNGNIYKSNNYVSMDRNVYMQGEITFTPDAPQASGTYQLGTFSNIMACPSLATAPTTLLLQVGCQ